MIRLDQALGLAVLGLFVVLYFVAWGRLERGGKLNLRSLLPVNKMRQVVQNAAETGTTVHYSPGNGGLNGQVGTPEALSGLTTLESLSNTTARAKGQLIASTNDTLTYLAATRTQEQEYNALGRGSDYDVNSTQFITQSSSAGYIAGVTYLTGQPEVSGSILVGQFGPEVLLAGDRGNQRDLPQVIGATQIQTLPVAVASAGLDNTLLGEEVYAAPGYLSRIPARLASLQVQDWLRIAIIVLIIVGVIAATLGLNVAGIFVR